MDTKRDKSMSVFTEAMNETSCERPGKGVKALVIKVAYYTLSAMLSALSLSLSL
jgi:hypothetical protein